MPPQEELAGFLPAVARVFVKGRLAGTGFYVGERLVMTCAHVISSAPEPPDTEVSVQFHSNETRIGATLQKEFWRSQDAEDVAVLQLDHAPANVPVLQLASSENRTGHECRTFGYPEGHEERLHATATVTGKLNEQGVIQIESTKITVGFSGAPFYDTKAHAVIGMVNAIAKKDRHHRLGDVAFVTPAETLHEVCDRVILRSLEAEEDMRKSLERLKQGAANAIRSSSLATEFFANELGDMSTIKEEDLPEAIVERLFHSELVQVLDLLVFCCSTFADNPDEESIGAAKSVKRMAAHIFPYVFSPAELRTVRTAIDNRTPIVVVPAKTETIVEIVMAGVDGREAQVDPATNLDGSRPQIQQPPEEGFSKQTFQDEFQQGLIQALRIKPPFDENPEDRINQVLARYRRRPRGMRYYFIYQTVDEPRSDQQRDSVIRELKARFPEVVFVKRRKPQDDFREFELVHQLCEMFGMEDVP